MTKKQKGIMLVMLVWAGLLIAVLYSPIGSPNLYSSQNYYAINQGVNFENNEIPNATKVRTSTDNTDNNDPDIPDVSGTELGATGSSVGNTPSATSSTRGSSYAMQSPVSQSNNSSGSTGGGGVVMMGGGGSRSSAGSSGISMTSGGITTLSSSNLSYSSVKQASKAQTLTTTGGTDPGGDPTGNPIPVGDGWRIFSLLGVCYAAFKKRGFLKNKLTFSAKRR